MMLTSMMKMQFSHGHDNGDDWEDDGDHGDFGNDDDNQVMNIKTILRLC